MSEPIDLAELERLRKAATPVPWHEEMIAARADFDWAFAACNAQERLIAAIRDLAEAHDWLMRCMPRSLAGYDSSVAIMWRHGIRDSTCEPP